MLINVDPNNNYEDSSALFTSRVAEELICGCECEKPSAFSRLCNNAHNWLQRFYPEGKGGKFDYLVYSKTYEGFLQSSPKF